SAEPEQVRRQIEEMIGLDASHAILTSAKEGIGTADVLEAIVRDIPPPGGDPDAPATALIFDSWFDPYHGAVVLVRVFDGQLAKGRRIRMMATGKEFLVTRIGVLAPRAVEIAELGPGEVGILMAAIKEVGDTKIGDTITDAERPAAAPLPGFRPVKPMVFSGLYPAESAQYDALQVDHIEEPYIRASIHLPTEFVGNVLALCEERRGRQTEMRYHGETRVQLGYELPLSEIVVDFYDKLKSMTRGYASMDYEYLDFRPGELVKLDILINGDVVDALSVIIHRDHAYLRGRELTQRLRALIPRQMFEVVIQAAIGAKVIARESVKALRKNVTAKCYGGDITRKRKLLERQKEGKKRMKQVGRVEIPQEAFLAVLKGGG